MLVFLVNRVRFFIDHKQLLCVNYEISVSPYSIVDYPIKNLFIHIFVTDSS